jgi:quercetin dioxygenase-like cupin family protein
VKHVHYDEVEAQEVNVPEAAGVKVRWLISEDDGAPTFCMRRFELQPGGHTPHHGHEWEHEVYILEGQGVVYSGDKGIPFRAGDVVYVPPDEVHHFEADADQSVAFLCLIPKSGK